ncbi:VWA domain-containing protein [Granulicella cerasi]|uniref:VWA domain-containing protein n=1 Tax=Granulicella cerasi TaxID=741063 RepID=UPI0021DF7E3C|nr:VWA domain-containing protein [Granulicella cerasi]
MRSLPLALLAAGSLSAAAQTAPASSAPSTSPEPQGYTLKTSTRLVVLDVVVLDKNDKPVTGLDKSQFTILEDKVPQRIRNFEPHVPPANGAPKTVVTSTADLKKIGTDPVDILVLDELNSKFEDMAYARDRMEHYLMRQPEVLPHPTQIVAAGDAHFVVLHDYTQSRQELLDAVKKHFPQYPWQMMRNSSGDGALERTSQTLGVLGQIADASSGTPGRKNVIWMGVGYPMIDTVSLDEEDQDKIMAVVKTITTRLQMSRVVLYVIDPQGVHAVQQDDGTDADGNPTTSGPTDSLGPFADKLDFASFATATGGAIFAERNDIDVAIADSLKEASVYYTLTYTPTSTDDAAAPFRKIVVKLGTPGLHAVTRQGYFSGPPPVEAAPTPTAKTSNQLKWDIAAAAQTTLPYNGLDVQARQDGKGYKLLVLAKDVTWIDEDEGSRRAEATIMVVCYNVKGKELLHKSIEEKERIPAGTDVDHGQHVAFPFAFDVPEKTSRIRFVVRDAGTGHIGTADVNLK